MRVRAAPVGEVKEALEERRPDLIVVGLPPAASATEPTLMAVRFAMRSAAIRVPLVALAVWRPDRPPGAASSVDAVVSCDLPTATLAQRILALAERSVDSGTLEKPLPPRVRSGHALSLGAIRAPGHVQQDPSVFQRGNPVEPGRRVPGYVQLEPAAFDEVPRVKESARLGPPRPGAERTSSSGQSAKRGAGEEVKLGEIQLLQQLRPKRNHSVAPVLASSSPSGEGPAIVPVRSKVVEVPRASHDRLRTGLSGIHDQPTSPVPFPPPEPEPASDFPTVVETHAPCAVRVGGDIPHSASHEVPASDAASEPWANGDPQNQLGTWLSQARDSLPASDAHPPLGHTPDTVRPPAQSERHMAEGGSPSTSGSSIRVPLSAPALSLSGVRAVLVDEDLTRADALAGTLRAHRVEVYLCSPHLQHFHVRLLRKFTPHVVIIDETAIRGAAAEFLNRLRSDPFLHHTQLLVVRLDRMFRARSGATQVDALLPMLQPLAQAEISLLEKLGPTCEVEFGLDEVPPHLLLKLLVPRRVSTQIECTRDDERFRWTVGWDCASDAELFRKGIVRTLAHGDAFDWLLSHRNCHAVVTQRPEKAELRGKPVLDLIERRLSEAERRERPQARMEMRPRLESLADLGRDEDTAVTHFPLSSARPVTLVEESPSVRLPVYRPRWVWGALGAVAAAMLGALALQNSTQMRAPGSSAASALAGTSTLREVDADQAANSPASPEQPSEVATETSDPLFYIPEMAGAPSCEQALQGWKPDPNQPSEGALVYLRQAQNHLMTGDGDAALRKLCQSATLLRGGAGSIELSRYYLNLRAYGLAEEHLKTAQAKSPDHIEVRMLEGDLASQRGDVEGARDAWRIALQLDDAFGKSAVAVGRKYFRDAELATRQADWPRAERYLRRAVTLAPDYQPASALLAAVLEKRGAMATAQLWRQRAEELRPEAPEAVAQQQSAGAATPPVASPVATPDSLDAGADVAAAGSDAPAAADASPSPPPPVAEPAPEPSTPIDPLAQRLGPPQSGGSLPRRGASSLQP